MPKADNMQNTNIDMKKWGNICLIISFLLMSIGIADFFVYKSNYSTSIILMSFAALFSSIKMRAEKDLAILRFAAGLCIVLAIFSQAILTQSQYFAVFGLAVLIVFALDYIKNSKYIKKSV